MNARTQTSSLAVACLFFSCSVVGCSKSESDTSAPGDTAAQPSASELQSQRPPAGPVAGPLETPPSTPPAERGQPTDGQATGGGQSQSSQPRPLTIADPPGGLPQRPLRADLSPQELIEFLAGADQDMQLIASGRAGISDPREARAEMKRITKLKLEASQQLGKHADADAAAKVEAARGELQSLSTLASLGDVKSADALQLLAAENLTSEDPSLASDSRMVLIGFAIESLQNGSEDAADEIVQLIDDLASSATPPDLPAMMVMGQARQVLAKFDHHQEAKQVRDKIIDLFANSSDPQIAKMAAQLAGSVRFDSIDKLRAGSIKGETIAPDRWREAVATLIDESPDLITVQYLAGAALEFEEIGSDPLAVATYDEMTQRFTNPEEATTREVKIAVQARAARLDVIGKQFDPDLPSTGTTKLSMKEYQGRVVLMPFWATGFPESLQVVPILRKLRDEDPEKVAIVGMNLDPAGAAVDAYADQQLGFPSFRSESSAAATMGNPVAARFGVVSLPFVAIINQAGKIEALDFSGRKLEPTVRRLLAE